jgi:ribonuclease H / adenosylcobalamin/alpha-ribazole phosphatase
MAPPRLRLLLIRHGETLANREFRYLGNRDEPLADSGRAQADCLALALAQLPVRAVYASPLRRAEETARPIASRLDVPLFTEPRLREQCFGEWEGLTRAEVMARNGGSGELERWEADPGATAPPGGEALEAVRERTLACVEDLGAPHRGEWIALVSHVGPIKALLCSALNVPLGTVTRMFLDPGTVSVIDWEERPMVRLFNAHAHLGWNAARWMN